MTVYIVRVGEDGPVKIGWTGGDVVRRIAEIQPGNPARLLILRTIEGARTEEAALHRHYAALRIEREWFHFDVSMLSIDPKAIPSRATATAPKRGRNGRKRMYPARHVIAKAGGIKHVSKLLGIHRSCVNRWMLPRTSGGSGGIVPARQAQRLIDNGLIEPADLFFHPDGQAAA